jgi:hypothetical protein
MPDLEAILRLKRDTRTLLSCQRLSSVAWQITWLEGARRRQATNALEPLARLIQKKTPHIEDMFEDGSSEQLTYAHAVADLMWRHETIAIATSQEV